MIETKIILQSLADSVARAKTVKEAYTLIARAANVEGVNIPTYEEVLKEIEAFQYEEVLKEIEAFQKEQ